MKLSLQLWVKFVLRITNSKKKEGNDWTDIVDWKSDVEAKTKGGPERETDHQHSSDGEENLFH